MVYNQDPNAYGLNFLGQGLGQGAAGLLSGILGRNDPRNIETRRAWSNPEAHMTEFGWASGTPKDVMDAFDIVGGYIPVLDANGKQMINPATGQSLLKWDQHIQRKGTPLSPGYQLMNASDPYKQFSSASPPAAAPKEQTPEQLIANILPLAGGVLRSPLRFETGGAVPNPDPIQALITLLEIDKKSRKGEVPAILHKGEGVVTEPGMRLLDQTVGGIDRLNQIAKKLPKMKEGGEVFPEEQKKKPQRKTKLTLKGGKLVEEEVPSESLIVGTDGKPVWVKDQPLPGNNQVWEMVTDTNGRKIWIPKASPGAVKYGDIEIFNAPPNQGPTMDPGLDKEGKPNWALVQNEYTGNVEWRPYSPMQVDPGKVGDKGTSSKQPPVKPQNKPTEQKKQQDTKVTRERVEYRPSVPQTQPAQMEYRGWNAPTQYSPGQLQGMNPFQAAAAIQGDVESRGTPYPSPVYGPGGNVLDRVNTVDRRMELQNKQLGQYAGTLQAAGEKQKQDWYPKEAQAQIDDINARIAYNRAMVAKMQKDVDTGEGLTPHDYLYLAQAREIDSRLSNSKISMLEDSLKLSKNMNERSRRLLSLEYLFTKYPHLADQALNDPESISSFVSGLEKKFWLVFPNPAWDNGKKEIQEAASRVINSMYGGSGQQPANTNLKNNLEGELNAGAPTSGASVTPPPGTANTPPPILEQLLKAQRAAGLIK